MIFTLPRLKKLARSYIHGFRALFTSLALWFPARKMIIVGITGTKGKTTTTVFVGRLLNALGIKTGYISTALLFLGSGEEFENPYKMTTIDPVLLQKYVKTMQYVGCKVVVLEMSSQGLESNRHLGLFGFDVAAFLNLTPEHLDAHGSMDNYAEAKSILFRSLRKSGTALVNSDSEYSNRMLGAIPQSIEGGANRILISQNNECSYCLSEDGYTYLLEADGHTYPTPYYSPVEVIDFFWASHIVKCAAVYAGQEVELNTIFSKSTEAGSVPGRMEFAAHSATVDALVDYAHEPESMSQLMRLVSSWKERGLYSAIIHVLSSDGVGRDDWKKEKLGQISREYADFTFITTDNYSESDNPQDIVNLIAGGLIKGEEGKTFFVEIDRKEAMKSALSRAKLCAGRVLIVSTGVGNEAGLTRPGGKIKWNEVMVWKEIFRSLGKQR